MKIKNSYNVIGALISAFFAITFSFFGPLGLYLSNVSEFWFSIGDIWFLPVIGGIITFLICFGISALFKGKAREVFHSFLFGVTLGLYIQGNWISTDYGVLDGKNIDWSKYSSVAIINSIIWVLCISLPIILRKKLINSWKKVISIISIFLVLVQVITLFALLIMTDLNQNNYEAYLTTDGQFELSNNSNIIIFILDAFDSTFFSQLLEQNPEIKDRFEDFTYYPDMVAGGATTKIAMPAILTGIPYTVPLSYKDYIDYAYTQTNLYKTLKDYNYNIGIYTLSTFVSSNHKNIIDNLITGKMKISSYSSLTKYLYKLTAFKYMPHILKNKFWLHSDIFNELQSSNTATTWNSDNVLFFNRLKEEGIKIIDEGNSFKIYYLLGAHPPYNMNEFAERVTQEKTSQLRQAKGCLYIIEEYINQLKQAGIYENSTIIVMADHGDIGHHHNPLFLIKESGKNHKFETSYSPVSYYDLHATLLYLITGEKKDNARTIFDFSEGDQRTRYFYFNASNNAVTSIIEYKITGFAGDDRTVLETGKVYSGNTDNVNGDYNYILGTVLNFGPNGEAIKHCTKGFSGIDMNDYTWTDEKLAEMQFELSKVPSKDLVVKAYAMVYNHVGPQRMIVKVKDNIVHADIYDEISTIEFSIPKEMINDNNLKLNFEFPDAVCPQELYGPGFDARTLAFAFMTISISEGIHEADTISSYLLGDVIEFKKGNDGTRYFKYGINKLNKNYAWSNGKKSWLIMKTDNSNNDLLCSINFANILNNTQQILVSSNGLPLYNGTVTNDKKSIEFIIPREAIISNIISLDFEYPDAARPIDLGFNEDKRILAVAFNSIVIKETKNNNIYTYLDESGIIDFTYKGNSEKYIVKDSQWYTQQDGYRWSGANAELNFTLFSNSDLIMTINGFVHPQSGGSLISINGKLLTELSAGRGFEKYEIKISKDYLNGDGQQTITFSSPNAISPHDAGTGEDKRKLGIAINMISISPDFKP